MKRQGGRVWRRTQLGWVQFTPWTIPSASLSGVGGRGVGVVWGDRAAFMVKSRTMYKREQGTARVESIAFGSHLA